MSSSYLHLLNLRNFSNGWRVAGWIILGPVLSLFLAYLTFIALFWISGGIHIDKRGTPFQEFVCMLTLPIVAAVAFGGSVGSLSIAARPYLQEE